MIRILEEGDYQAGHTLGLAHPRHWDEDKRKYAEIMWHWRCERLRQIGRVDVHVIGGDMVQGPGIKGTLGLLTTDPNEQADWAVENVRMVKADYRYFTYGTPAHSAQVIRAEDRVAEAFGQKPRETWRLGPFHGRRLMDRHVVGISRIPYGQGTLLWREWVRDQLKAVMEDYRAADLHVRHHVHTYLEMRNARGHAVICPCWQFPPPPEPWDTPYSWTLMMQYYDVGFLLIEIDHGGEVYVRPQIMELKMAIPQRYTCPKIKENV